MFRQLKATLMRKVPKVTHCVMKKGVTCFLFFLVTASVITVVRFSNPPAQSQLHGSILMMSITGLSYPNKQIQRPPCDPGTIPHKKFLTHNNSHPLDVTVVTAYFNLGRFRKGDESVFDTQLYMSWSGVFKHLRNPFVFYTDSEDIAKQFQQMRVGKEGITKIVLVDRKNLWAFGWVDRIKEIYSNPGYPKFHPNTVVPEYSCAQHAKYESVEAAVKSNYFNTTYYTWIDIGYFRYILKRGKEFVIVKPQGFNESCVAMNKVNDVDMGTPPETVFKGNHVWLGGGMIFGSKFTLPIFIADYRQAVQHYLDMSLSSTDQQAILIIVCFYYMHCGRSKTPPSIL